MNTMQSVDRTSQAYKTEKLDKLRVRLISGQNLAKALREENCTNWYHITLTETERAPIVALVSEQAQLAEQAQALSNTVLMFGSVTPKDKEDFQALCSRIGTTTAERISQLILQDLKAGLRN